MAALALSYFASPQFSALRSSSQYVYRRTIERLCKDHGDRRAADLRRDHVVKLMSRLAGKPHAANTLRRALRNLMTHAIDIGIRGDDPTRDVKAIRIKSGGHHSSIRAVPCDRLSRPASARLVALYRATPRRCHPHDRLTPRLTPPRPGSWTNHSTVGLLCRPGPPRPRLHKILPAPRLLPPAADMPLNWLSSESCQNQTSGIQWDGFKSHCDESSLVLAAHPRGGWWHV
jgi:hypothetical protein